MPACLRDALSQADAILLLDGPLGTRLVDHGFEVDRPGWSARALLEAPELVERIHREYVAAGSQLLTANTFRTHQRNLDAWGQYQRAEELTHLAVSLARRAAGITIRDGPERGGGGADGICRDGAVRLRRDAGER